jgi:cold shock CspA family protein
LDGAAFTFDEVERMAGETGPARERGAIVTWGEFDTFGFLQRDKDPRGRQVFVHVSEAGQRLQPGTRITYALEHHARGLRATDVHVEHAGARQDEGSAC